MTSEPNQSARNQRRRIGRCTAWLATFVITIGVVAWAHSHFTDSERIRRLAEQYLENMIGGSVHVGGADLSLTAGLRLFDVRVDADESMPSQATGVDVRMGADEAERLLGDHPIFACRRLEVRHNPWATLLGRLSIESVQAIEPCCTIVHDTTTGQSSLARMIRRLRERSTAHGLGAALPVMELRDARVRVLARNTVGMRHVEDLRLTLRGGTMGRDPSQYDIVWHVPGTSGSGGHSRLDLHTGYIKNVSGGLPAMSIEAVMLAINATYDGAGAWNALLGLDGKVRVRDFDLIGKGNQGLGRSVTIDLSEAAISIPINEIEHDLPRTQRFLRFVDVDGTVTATTRELRADFAGSLRGASCRVHAAFRGDAAELHSLEDVAFDVQLAMRDFAIPRNDLDAPPEEARFVNHFSRIAENIQTFDPHGVVDVDVHVSRAKGPGEPVRLQRALITLRGNDIAVKYFPYRGTDVTGEIEITPEGVDVRGLRGTHDGAVILVDGWLEEPNRCSAATFTIRAADVPIDEALLDALRPKDRETARSFSPKGRVDIDVDLQRAACVADQERGAWSSMVDIGFAGEASASYEPFPYRIEKLLGHVIIGGGQARVVDVRGVPLVSNVGSVRVEGAVGFGQGGVQSVDLTVKGTSLELDKSVVEALPKAFRARLSAFHANGRFDIETRVGFEPDTHKLIHESHVELLGVSVDHEAFPLPIRDIRGPMKVTTNRLDTPGLTGRHGDTLLALRGAVDPTDPMHHTELFASCQDATLDQATLAYLPSNWLNRLGSWRVESPFDLDLEVRAIPGDAPQVDVRGVARLAEAVVRHEPRGLELTGVHGEVSFDRASLRGLDVTGRWGDAPFRSSFEFHQGSDDPRGVASFEAQSVPLNETMRAVLPPRAQSAWDRLQPDGRADVYIDRLILSAKPENPEEGATATLDGRLVLHDVSLRAPGTPKQVSGEVKLSGYLVDRLGGTLLSGSARLDRMTLLDRDLDQINADWNFVQTADGRGQFEVPRLQAGLYGGSAMGDMEINFGADRSTYRLSTTIQDADLNPVVNAAPSSGEIGSGPTDVAGRLNAHVYLSGIIGDLASRRGGGQCRISQGRIYELPLMAAILHVLNVSLPTPDELQQVDASYFVMGDSVELGPLILRGGGIQLLGTGTMTLTDYSVDLNLANVNPRRWGRIPVLADFVEGASRELVGVRVTGPIGQPTVHTRPLGGLSDEFKKLFQKRPSPPIPKSGT